MMSSVRPVVEPAPAEPSRTSLAGASSRKLGASRRPNVRVVIAGTFPPPFGGQNINTKRLFELLGTIDGVESEHWRFSFSPDLESMRRRDWRKALRLFGTVARLVRLRRRGRIDWIVYPSGGPHLAPVIRDIILLPIAAWLCRRLIVQFRAAGVAEGLAGLPALLRIALRWAHGRAHGAVSLTTFGTRDPESLGMARVHVIPNAIEDLNTEGRTAAGATLDFLYIGHVCRDKGVDALIPAFARLHAKHPEARLRIVGEVLAPYTIGELTALIAAEGLSSVVAVEGKLDSRQALEAYRRSEVVVFPSVAPYESFGMVLIEAMMHGRVLVVSDWRANAQVVTPEFGGCMYPPGLDHAAHLAQALEACVLQRACWSQWGARNRDVFKRHYTIAQLARNWSNLLLHES